MSSTTLASGSTLDLAGAISYETIEVQGTTADTDLVLTNSATFDNAGTILLDGTDSRIYGTSGLGYALENVNGTVEGAGQIGISSSSYDISLINESSGTIDANSTLQLELLLEGSPPASNAGLIESTNTGGLVIANFGAHNPAVTIDNAGGTILASGTGDNVILSGADLAGGTLAASNGGVIEAATGFAANTLDGSTTPITITGASTIEVPDPGLHGDVQLFLSGTIDNAGTILDATTGDLTDDVINAGGAAVLTGGGTLDLAGPNARIYGTGSTPGTLDNVNNTIEGTGQVGINGVGNQLALINEAGGTVDANSTQGMTIALGGPTLSNAGLIETSIAGAALTIDSPVSGTGALQIGAGTEISLESTVASGQTIKFVGSPDVLAVSQALSMDGTIDGFGPQDRIYLPNVPFNRGADTLSYSDSTLTIENSGTTLASLYIPGTLAISDFTLAPSTNGGSNLTTDKIACFVAGTRIATDRGEVPVEELRIGDGVLTPGGAVRPVLWIGNRRTDCRRHPRPDLVWPVRIRAGAFGDDQPRRDLLLSPDHALSLPAAGGGAVNVLIPVRYLINGATIAQETVAEVHYFHIELARHDILLAENLAAESYLDTGNRAQFENGAAHRSLHPDFSALTWANACAPLCLEGPAVSAARRRLVARAHRLGYGIAEQSDLRVLAGGRSIRAAAVNGSRHQFVLPATTRDVRIVSPTGAPAGSDPAAEDGRRLGACIGAVCLGDTSIPLDSPSLASGFHRLERSGHELWRWTDGDARIVLPHASAAPALLELLVRDTTRALWQPKIGITRAA